MFSTSRPVFGRAAAIGSGCISPSPGPSSHSQRSADKTAEFDGDLPLLQTDMVQETAPLDATLSLAKASTLESEAQQGGSPPNASCSETAVAKPDDDKSRTPSPRRAARPADAFEDRL